MTTLFDDVPELAETGGRELPPLIGTEKQLPWANAVREKLLKEIDRHIREWQRYIATLQARDLDRAASESERLRAALDRLAEIEAQTTCRYWLDRRENTALELLAGAEPKPGGWRG